jgi:hypothetical protein
VLESLGDVVRVAFLGDNCVQGGLVQSPTLASASGLHKSSEVRLGNVETRKPDHLGFLNLIPILVLLVTTEEVLEPAD